MKKLLTEITAAIESFDHWITREIELETVTHIAELGFRHLNDILVYKYLPQFREGLEHRSPKGDDLLILSYGSLWHIPEVQQFTGEDYLDIVQTQLLYLPVAAELLESDRLYRKLLLQNLVIVSFTLERWGQFILKHQPGETVRSLTVGKSVITLHDYLTAAVGNYNTISTFAFSSITGVTGVYAPVIESGKLKKGRLFKSPSAYQIDSDRIEKDSVRFPSILKLDAFPLTIKKGELISYAYNTGILNILPKLKIRRLHEPEILRGIQEITIGFKSSTYAFSEFLKDPNFNEAKFIYLLRQLTVELGVSPAALVLQELRLSKQDARQFKGLMDHYLLRTVMNKQERQIFIGQLLLNEEIQHPDVSVYIQQSFEVDGFFNPDRFKQTIDSYPLFADRERLVNCIEELVTQDRIGKQRIGYALHLLKKNAPQLSASIDEKMEDVAWLEEISNAMVRGNYHLVPSGANSMAFYGPDVFLGHADCIPNYYLHILNRLNVMAPDDRQRFWEFQNHTHNLSMLLKQHLQTELRLPSHLFLADSDKSIAEIIKEVLLQYPYLATYIDLFETYSVLSMLHNSSVERFIRRVRHQMPSTVKEKLISSPDYGTTSMQPDLTSATNPIPLTLPTLNEMTQTRYNHLFKAWLKPLKGLRNQGLLSAYPDPSSLLSLKEYESFYVTD